MFCCISRCRNFCTLISRGVHLHPLLVQALSSEHPYDTGPAVREGVSEHHRFAEGRLQAVEFT